MKKPARAALPDEPGTIEGRIEELERKFDRLRGLYESFFMGVERQPPNTPRRDLNRLMLEMQQTNISNAGLRFRFQSLMQKWVLYTTYWNRTFREIEAGTYRRDVAKVQRHLAKTGGALNEAEAMALGIPSSRVKAFVEKQGKAVAGRTPRPGSDAAGTVAKEPPASVAAPPPAPTTQPVAPPRPPGLSDSDLRGFYQRYVDARQVSQDPRPAIPFEQLRGRLLEQAPRLLEDKRVHRIELEVAVEDGKVKVRAKPVRD